MKNSMLTTLIIVLNLFSISAIANEYLIHKPEDNSTYVKGETSVISKIVDSYGSNWKQYSNFLGKKNQWIWTDNSNQLWLYNELEGDSYIFVDLDEAVGTEYDIKFNHCTSQSKITANNLVVDSIAGTLNNVVELSLTGPCADAGLTTVLFAPGIGVLRYGQANIAGEEFFELNSALIGGVLYQHEIDRSADIRITTSYRRDDIVLGEQESVDVFITLENNSAEDYIIAFNSTQLFDIELINSANEVINSWANDKVFLQYLNEINIPAGGKYKFGAAIMLQDSARGIIEQGRYIVKLTLKGYEKDSQNNISSMPLSVQFPIKLVH